MALFNNSFPATYSPYYPQVYQPSGIPAQGNNQQSQNSGIIWVQGEAGAKSYLVAPNMTVPLWDSENQVIYLKSADASGMPSIKTIDYTVRGGDRPKDDSPQYALKSDLEDIREQIESLKSDIDKVRHAKTKKVVEVEDDE